MSSKRDWRRRHETRTHVGLWIDTELWTAFKLITFNAIEGRFNKGQITETLEALLRRYLVELAEIEAHQLKNNEVLNEQD